jgi:hypothetical protein
MKSLRVTASIARCGGRQGDRARLGLTWPQTPSGRRHGRTEKPLVFFGTGSGLHPLADVTLKDVLRRLGHGDVTVHGMRSCFRDWCADTGRPAELAKSALAHLPASVVVQAYQRSDLLDARRGLMAEWAAFLTAPPAQVITLRAAG